MKTSYFLNLTALILITSYTAVFPQSESHKVYYTNDISFDYSADSLIAASTEKGKNIIVSSLQKLDDINTVSILNDSVISVSGNNIINAKLNINKINSIKIRNGSYLGLGAGIGALVGLGVGIFIVTSSDYGEPSASWENLIIAPVEAGVNIIWGVLSTISGALIGGIIGGNISSFDKYYMVETKYNKRMELERILRIDGKLNNNNR